MSFASSSLSFVQRNAMTIDVQKLAQLAEACDVDDMIDVFSDIPLTVDFLRLFSRTLRSVLAPDSNNFKQCNSNGCSWDGIFAILFTCLFRYSSPSACWPRICKTLILRDAQPFSAKGGKNIWNGVVAVLMDRYFKTFDCIYENRFMDVSTFLRQRHDPMIKNNSRLGFDTTFLRVVSIVPAQWTILHHAAHWSSKEMLIELIECGAEVGVLDADRRHPLHIAAISLNFDALDYLVDQHGRSFTQDIDIYDKTPLDLLLQSVSLSDWAKRVSPMRLLSSVVKLLNTKSSLWTLPGASYAENGSMVTGSRITGESIYSNKLYAILHCIRGRDRLVAAPVVELAWSCPTVTWNIPIVMHCILLSVRQRRFHLLECLLEHFSEILFSSFQLSELADQSGAQVESFFLQYCLYVAVHSKASLRIVSLLTHYSAEQFSSRGLKQIVDSVPLTEAILVSVMRCSSFFSNPSRRPSTGTISLLSHSQSIQSFNSSVKAEESDTYAPTESPSLVLDEILTMFGPSAIQLPTYPSYRGILGVDGQVMALTDDFPTMWSPFVSSENMENLLRNFTPLSMACLLGCTATADILLQHIPTPLKLFLSSSVAHSLRLLVPHGDGMEGLGLGGVEGLGWNPIICCILSSSPVCLMQIRHHMGPEIFSDACWSSDETDLTPVMVMLHLVKAHSLHRKRLEDRLPPAPFTCSLGGARRSHEDVTQILNILLDAHPSTLGNHPPPFTAGSKDSASSLWETRYEVLVARYDLVERRLSDLIALSTDVHDNSYSDRDSDDEEIASVCQTLRVQWDNRQPQPSPGSGPSRRSSSGKTSFFPTALNTTVLHEISQSKGHYDAKRLIHQSRAVWDELEVSMGTPRGVHTLYYRMRSFLRTVYPDRHFGLIAECLVLVLNDEPIEHRGLPLGTEDHPFQGDSDNEDLIISIPSSPEQSSKGPQRPVRRPSTAPSTLLLCWKELVMRAGITVGPGSSPSTCSIEHFESLCRDLLAVSNPLKSRYGSGYNSLNGDEGDDSSESGGWVLSESRWREVKASYSAMKKKWQPSKGHHPHREIVDLLTLYIRTVVQDGEVLYGSQINVGDLGLSCPAFTLRESVEVADLIECREQLDEVLPYLHYMRSADAIGLKDGCPLLATLLSTSSPPSSVVQLCAAYRGVMTEAVASGLIAARSSSRAGDTKADSARDIASAMQTCVKSLVCVCSSRLQTYGESDGSPEIMYNSVTLHRSLLSLTALGYWDAALVMMRTLAAVAEKEREKGTVPDSPFRCCSMSIGSTLDAALHAHTSSLSPVRATTHPLGPLGKPTLPSAHPQQNALDESDTWERICPANMFPISPLHYAAASGQFSFLQKALELFPCDKIPKRLILDVISLFVKNCTARKRRNKLLSILVSSLVSRLELVPGSSPSPAWGQSSVPDMSDPLYHAAWNALESMQHSGVLQSITMGENGGGNGRGVGPGAGLGEVCPQHEGPLRGLCIRSTTHPPRINTPPHHPSRSHVPQPLSAPALVLREWTSIAVPGDVIETSVVMMDGSSIPLHIFTSDIDNLYKALPTPQMARGISCTGHTLLQEAARLKDPSLLASLLEAGEAGDTESRRGSYVNGSDEMLTLVSEIGTGFMMNGVGETALCLALGQGHLELANSMIKRAVGEHHNSLQPLYLDSPDFPRSASPPMLESQRSGQVQGSGQGQGQGQGSALVLIDRLYIEATGRSTVDSVKALFLTSATQRVQQAEEEHRAVSTEQLSFPPMAANVNVLLKVFARLEVLQKEISSCDFKNFVRLSYSPPGIVLDSLIRAKMVLTLLGIPFSKMGVAFEPPVAAGNEKKDPVVRNCLNPANLNPQGVLGLLSHCVTGQLRDLLVKWCRFRVEESEYLEGRGAGESMSNYTDSASLTEILLLFHRLDVTLVDVGEMGGYFPSRLHPEALREGRMHSPTGGPAHLHYPSFAPKSPSQATQRQQDTERERRGRPSDIFDRDLDRYSDPSKGTLKSLPDQIVVETRIRYRGSSHRSPTNPSPYTYQPALSSPSHSVSVPPSPLKTSFATIIPSFRESPHQDEFVRTREMTPLKVSFAASVPSVREANHQDDHARSKEMAAFTECWARDPASVREALRLSYLILDFARLLVVARSMVLMTTEYGFSRPDWTPTGGPRSRNGQLEAHRVSDVHPLEKWQREVTAANELKEKMRDAYSVGPDNLDRSLVPSPASAAMAVAVKNSCWLSDGLRSRLRILDHLTGEDLLQYFRISKENNPQYSASRETLVRCIVLLLQSTGNQKLAEATSRLLRSSRIPLSSRGPNSRNMHGSSQHNSPLPSRWHSHTDSKDENDVDPSRTRQAAVDSEDCHRIVNALRALRVGDICPPRVDLPVEKRTDPVEKKSRRSKSVTSSAEYMIRLETLCEEFLGPFNAPFTSVGQHKDNNSPPMSPYKQTNPGFASPAAEKKAVKDSRNGNTNGNVQMKNGLEKANRTAAILTDFIRSIRGIYRQRAIYRLDVGHRLGEIKANYNPLCALLSSCPPDPVGLETARDLQRSPRAECCRRLISLGVKGTTAECTGRVPIAAAALRGDNTGNYFLKEMLQQTARARASSVDSRVRASSVDSRVRASSVDSCTSTERPNLNGVLPIVYSKWGEELEYLIWHVLMECPPCDTSPSPYPARQPVAPILGPGDLPRRASATFTQEEDCVISKCFSKALTTFKSKKTAALHKSLQEEKERRRRGHEATLQLLLDNDFPVRRPPGAALRCLDLGALKMIPRGILMAIATAEVSEPCQDTNEKGQPKIPVPAGQLTPPSTPLSSVAKLFGAPDQTPQQAPSPSAYGYEHPSSPQYGANPMHNPDGAANAPTHFKAIHFILLGMGLPSNNVLDVVSDDEKEDNVGEYGFPFLASLLDDTFGRLTVSGAIFVDQMLTADDLQRDIAAHASYMALHQSIDYTEVPSSPSASPSAAATAAIVLPRFTIHEHAAYAKAIIAGSLRSFFPTTQSRLKRVQDTVTPCPFWRGAHRSINTLVPEKSSVDARGQRLSPNSCKSHSGFLADSNEGDYLEDVLVTCSWNVVHLAVRSGRIDVLRYLLNMPQLPSDGTVTEDEKHVYLGGSLQFMRGRRVPVDKPSLSLTACFYDQPVCLDTLRSYDGPPAKGPKSTALKLPESPNKRLVQSMSRRNSMSAPIPEFKILADFYFEPLGCAFSLLGMSAYSGGLKCLHYLLGLSTVSDGQEVRVREDINIAWAIAVECLCHGYLTEDDLLAIMQYVIKQLQSSELSVWREMKRESERKNSLMTLFDVSSIVPYRESVSLLVNALRPLSSLEAGQAKIKRRRSSIGSFIGTPQRESQDYELSTDLDSAAPESPVEDSSNDPAPLPYEESVFQLCIRRGYSSLVQVLLQYGADMQGRDGRGFTPWRLSVCGGHSKVTALLGGSLPKTGEVHKAAQTIAAAFRVFVRRRRAYRERNRNGNYLPDNQEISGQTTRDEDTD